MTLLKTCLVDICIFLILITYVRCYRFFEKVLLAHVGSTILDIDTKHFEATIHSFDVETPRIRPLLVICFCSYRSFVPSVRFLVVPGPALDRQNPLQK